MKDKFEGNGKFVYDKGEYYIGPWMNGLRHGKGILYDKSGNKLYNGNFINGGFEGKSKLVYDNSDYYVGQLSTIL